MKSLVWTSLSLLLLMPLSAQAQTGREIVRKVETLHKAKDERTTIEMQLITKTGKRDRKLSMLFKEGKGDDDKTLLRFLEPDTVRNLAVLTLEATGRSDDQYLYVPAFKKARRLASSKRSNRFAQTDFTFEDLRTEDFSAFDYKRLKDKTLNKTLCFVIKATPKAKNTNSGYKKRLLYVEQKRHLTLRIKFYDKKSGEHFKTLTNGRYAKVQGKWRPTVSLMKDSVRKSKTVMKFVDRKLNKGVPDSLFTVSALERGM